MTHMKLTYLGPEGTFTHQAAIEAGHCLKTQYGIDEPELVAAPDVSSIMASVQSGESWGVIAWENNVEGYVMPNLDALIDAHDAAGLARVGINVSFDAFVTPGTSQIGIDGASVSAHPHGLAQCKRFIERHRLHPAQASSNAAACRDLKPGNVALGPHICGDLYGLEILEEHVEDFDGAHTDFLVIAPRGDVLDYVARTREREFETVITFIPLATGPGVVANLLDVLRDCGLNMTSLISRPIKGHDGTYSFIITLDAAPWEPRFRRMLVEVAEHGDWAKTIAVYPRRERPNPPVNSWMLPEGGVRLDSSASTSDWQTAQNARRELLW